MPRSIADPSSPAGIAEDAGPDKSYSARYLRTEDGVPLSTKELHELSVSGALPDGPAAEGVESPALVEKTDIEGTVPSIIERRPALFFTGHISPIFAPFFLVFSRFSPS